MSIKSANINPTIGSPVSCIPLVVDDSVLTNGFFELNFELDELLFTGGFTLEDDIG